MKTRNKLRKLGMTGVSLGLAGVLGCLTPVYDEHGRFVRHESDWNKTANTAGAGFRIGAALTRNPRYGFLGMLISGLADLADSQKTNDRVCHNTQIPNQSNSPLQQGGIRIPRSPKQPLRQLRPVPIQTSPYGKLNRIWIEHDVSQDGVQGMNVHADFNLHNAKGQRNIYPTVYFFPHREDNLMESDSLMAPDDGRVAIQGDLVFPTSANSALHARIFVPYEHLVSSRTPYVEFCVAVEDCSEATPVSLAQSERQYFSLPR